MVKPYRSAAAAKQVVAGVRAKLSQGLLKPGQRLPNERELAAELAVNIVGVRKGVRLLKAMGVIETRLGLGNYVASAPPSLELEPLALLAPLQSFSERECLIARRLLEVSLAGLAANNASEDDLVSMAEEVTDMYACLDNRSEYLRHDILFHRALATAAGSPILATLTDMVSAVLYDIRRETVAKVSDLRSSVEMHRKIYGAIRSGNAEEARSAMSEHLLRTEQEIYH